MPLTYRWGRIISANEKTRLKISKSGSAAKRVCLRLSARCLRSVYALSTGRCARSPARSFGLIAPHINAESPLDRETTTSTTISPFVGGSSRWGSRTKAAESTCGLRSGPREHGRAARNFGDVRWRVETTSTRGQVTRAGGGACAVLCIGLFRAFHQSAPRRPIRGAPYSHNNYC